MEAMNSRVVDVLMTTPGRASAVLAIVGPVSTVFVALAVANLDAMFLQKYLPSVIAAVPLFLIPLAVAVYLTLRLLPPAIAFFDPGDDFADAAAPKLPDEEPKVAVDVWIAEKQREVLRDNLAELESVRRTLRTATRSLAVGFMVANLAFLASVILKGYGI